MALSQADIRAVAKETSLSVDEVARIAKSVDTLAGKLQGSLLLPRIRSIAQLRCNTTVGRVRRAFWCLMARALGAVGL